MQEKPAWVTVVEDKRREMGLPTVSEEFSRLYDAPSPSNSTSAQENQSSPTNTGSSGSSGSSGNYIAADPQGVDNYHAKYSANYGNGMTPSDLKELEAHGVAWNQYDALEKEALANGQPELAAYYKDLKDQEHEAAEAKRNLYGYSGGEDGSQFIPFTNNTQKAPTQMPTQTTQTATSSQYDLTDYLKQSAAAQLEAHLADLKYAYEQNLALYDAQTKRLPGIYDPARNRAAAQYAMEKKSFDEYAAAAGLSSGAVGQSRLAQSNTYQNNLSQLDLAQANALSQLEEDTNALKREYENALVQARSTNSANLATALYEELVRVQGLDREDRLWETQQQMNELELFLKYGDKFFPEDMQDTTTSSGTGGKKKGYDNGSLSDEQIKTLQEYYGLTVDGMWGPNSQSTTGMSADEAWADYLSGAQYFGDQKPADPKLTSASYYPDEGIVVWNGTIYSDIGKLEKAIQKAGLSQSELDALIANLTMQGVKIFLK